MVKTEEQIQMTSTRTPKGIYFLMRSVLRCISELIFQCQFCPFLVLNIKLLLLRFSLFLQRVRILENYHMSSHDLERNVTKA